MKHSLLITTLAWTLMAPLTASAQNDAAGATTDASNPEISLILQGRYFNTDGEGHIVGFLPAGHGHGEGSGRGFTLDHSELAVGGSIDPYFRGLALFAIAAEEIETEEAWIQTTSIGGGVTIKAGRYLSGIGYTNEIHPHAWDFADQNLAYSATLGEHHIHDGVQLKWVAPTPVFLEFGVEKGQGANWVDRSNMGSHAAYVHVGGDAGESVAWRGGVSYLRLRADDREGDFDDDNDVETEVSFDGKSEYWMLDFVLKWAPGGNARDRNFKIQGEFLRRLDTGELTCEDNTADGGACGGITDTYRARQTGWYLQGIYQFAPRWRAGYRFDRLNVGTLEFGPGYAGVFSDPDFVPQRNTVMVDFSPTEFSRFRVQWARSSITPDGKDTQVALQYVHSLGKHGAHRF